MIRSMLFLPGNNPAMLMNGGYLGADAVILDLEDAISPDEKDAARILSGNALRTLNFGKCRIIVRINSIETPYWEDDLEKIVPLQPDVIMPTKVSAPDYIRKLSDRISSIEEKHSIEAGKTKLIPLIETALGVEHAYEIAISSKRIEALYLGAEDLSADLRSPRTKEGNEIAYARARLVYAARAAGIEAYDTPFTDIEDLEGLEQDALLAKGLGYTGKAAIYPGQVGVINTVFSPGAEEIRYARIVFEALEEAKRHGKGAVSLNGKMIDAPIVERARLVLEAAEKIEKEYV